MAMIKIIDDDIEIAQNLATILEKEGHSVNISSTVEGALEDLAREKPDLLILDVMFPDNPTAGFDLARKIRQKRETRQLPVILLTAINREFPMDFSAAEIDPNWVPAHDFMDKPVDSAKLLKKIRKLLQTSGE